MTAIVCWLNLIFMTAIFVEGEQWNYLTHIWGRGGKERKDMGFHIFSEDFSPKVNLIAWLEIKLTYSDIIVQHFSHNATETPAPQLRLVKYITVVKFRFNIYLSIYLST